MKSTVVRWFGAVLTAGALGFAGVVPSYAQTTTTTVIEGVPGVEFTFQAAGFRANEDISFWINTPDGKVISTEPLDQTNNFGNSTKPMTTWADANGSVTINWTAPMNALTGDYSLVIRGIQSKYQQVISFRLNKQGSQTVTQYDVVPASGQTGTVFVFHATGFRGSANIDGEQVSFWINTPDGKIISTEPLIETSPTGNTTKPLVAQANSDGIVKMFWSAPADALPGNYSLVAHGIVSQREVVIAFRVQ
ncbi:MAG: hypothetical protein WCK70_13025 [Chloroflexales bacterium]